MKITDDILYVGVNDHKVDLFEGQFVVPLGMAYNSYVIKDDSVAVLDTVDAGFADEWLANVAAVTDKVDYLVVHHMEPDHSANIRRFAEVYPDANKGSIMMDLGHRPGALADVLIRFAAAGFTNLSRDHFDYHHNFEEYFAAKCLLFRQLGEQFTSKGMPVYLGEFGCDAHATEEGEACRLRYLTMIGEEAKKANVPVVIWDNSYPGAGPEHHAYFDHNDGHVVPGAEKIIENLAKIFD